MANFRNIGVGLQILILKILNVWMPVTMFFIGVVKILARLDLAKILSLLDGHYLECPKESGLRKG